jgi:hypothetical protein
VVIHHKECKENKERKPGEGINHGIDGIHGKGEEKGDKPRMVTNGHE